MIDANAIISKTQKGKDELQNRTHRLSSRLRSLLFMVENNTYAGTLLEKARSLGSETLLQELIEQGFVAVDGVVTKTSVEGVTDFQLSSSETFQESSEIKSNNEKEFIEIKALVLNCIKASASIWDMRSLTKLVSSAHTPQELLSSFSMVEQKITDKSYSGMLNDLRLKIIAINNSSN